MAVAPPSMSTFEITEIAALTAGVVGLLGSVVGALLTGWFILPPTRGPAPQYDEHELKSRDA